MWRFICYLAIFSYLCYTLAIGKRCEERFTIRLQRKSTLGSLGAPNVLFLHIHSYARLGLVTPEINVISQSSHLIM